MLKKIITTTLISFSLLASHAALAGMGPYLGGSINLNDNFSSQSSFRGLSGALLGGFGGTVSDDFYLAGELFGEYGSVVLDNNVGFGSPSLRTTYSYGLSMLPGLMLSNRTMSYLRFGLLKTNFIGIGTTATGGQIGFGIQTSLTQDWDLRGEYDYVGYQKIRGISPSTDQFKLGFIYKFN